MSLEKSSPPYGTQLYPKVLLDIYRSIRLVTELRLAGATTIEEANAVLKEFLDRFNARFGVAARHPETAYRPLGPGACLDTVLCFRHSRRVARDNTVKYRWRTLHLLPGTEQSPCRTLSRSTLTTLSRQLPPSTLP